MTRMLMAAAYEGNSCNPGCGCEEYSVTRTAQRMREKRRWQKYDQGVLLYFSPRFVAEDDYDADPSDCRHGCNGDCLIYGSDNCTLTCHPDQHADDPRFDKHKRHGEGA